MLTLLLLLVVLLPTIWQVQPNLQPTCPNRPRTFFNLGRFPSGFL